MAMGGFTGADPTPTVAQLQASNSAGDLRYVLAVARTIGTHMSRYTVVVTKSTVPVGTADKVRREVDATLQSRRVGGDAEVVAE